MLAKFQKTLFEKETFSICSLVPENPNEIPQNALSNYGTFIAVGNNIPHSQDVQISLEGEWENSKYGVQLKVLSCIAVMPKTEEGIIAFLASGILPYIKHKMAIKLFNHFGTEVFEVLKKNPNEWLKVKGISSKKLKAIQEAYTINYGYQDLLVFLAPHGVSVAKIKKIVDKFGANSNEIVRNNPYNLFKINGFGFKTVDEIAQKVNTPLNDSLRIMGAVKIALTEQQSQGHLCMPQENLRSLAFEMLNEDYENQIVSLKEVTDAIVKMAQDGILKGDNGMAYLSWNYDNEVFAAEKIRKLLFSTVQPITIDSDISEFEQKNFVLAQKQREAIMMFFANRFSIITGGPGTGKSTVLKAIVETVYRHNAKADILLLAPTGKAARRMTETTSLPASTIHSGLGIREDTKIGDLETCTADVVIVDESSMCDMKLFALLLSAIDVQKTHLLLVGDADQLPSVGAGNVLNELICCGKIPVTKLNLVYRQGKQSTIPVNAEKINLGNSKLFYNNEDFQFVEADTQELCRDSVINFYLSEVQKLGIENVCVLCPMKSKGLNCVNEYNKIIQRIINPTAPNKNELQFKNGVFRVGDRIMQIKNTQEISNGETGVIKGITTDEDGNITVSILFDGKSVTMDYFIEDMENIVLAYAITIHKSQGSEYKSVIIPMMKSFYVMLKRNLLYTAVTRAKQRVCIVGQKQAIYMAVNTTETDKRMTQLGERI